MVQAGESLAPRKFTLVAAQARTWAEWRNGLFSASLLARNLGSNSSVLPEEARRQEGGFTPLLCNLFAA